MDDPISALDAHVRKQIFRRVFCGMLKDKTRILATHAIEFLHLADRIVVMHQGEIKAQGSYEDVLEHPIVKKIVKIHNKHKKEKKKVLKTNDEPATPISDAEGGGYSSATSFIEKQCISGASSSCDEAIEVSPTAP